MESQGGKRGIVPLRHSDNQVSVGAKRYKQSIRVFMVNSEYLISGSHMSEDLYNVPGAWSLVPIFGPRYAGPKK